MIAIYILLALVTVSMYEYLGHRFALHRPHISFGRDHLEHHRLFARDFNFPDEQPNFYDQYWVRTLFGALWSSLIWIPLLCFGLTTAAITFGVTASLHGLIWQWIHNEMHRPKCLLLQKCRYFQFMRQFHLIHHLKPRTNFAFLFAPLWDWVFGTYRKTV